MIPRLYRELVELKLSRYPAVAIVGPRQCGKTTLARSLGGCYFDLETEGSALRLDAEWETLAMNRERVIIDEAQQAPEVFRRLRGTIDEDRTRMGRFLLLGSVSPSLTSDVGESLAGRIGFVEMGPLCLSEIGSDRLDDLWLRGGYPDGGILDAEMYPVWQEDFVTALTARDLPNWGLPARPQLTLRLLRMLGALHGQAMNASKLGSALGLDYKTVAGYCDFLEGAFLIRWLPAYFANAKKRLVKTPRVYLRDSGLLHALMRVRDINDLYSQPWVGQSWEGFLIEQTLAALAVARREAEAFFFRTSDGFEIDLVLEWGATRWAIETKLTSNPSASDLARFNKAADMIGADRRILLCRVGQPFETGNVLVTNPADWCDRLRED